MMTRQLRVGLAASGEIALTIPSPSGGEHTVEIPCTADGLRLLRETLQRHSATPPEKATLGSPASPNQHDVDAMILAFKPKARKPSPPPEVDLDSLDLSSLKL